MKLFRTIGISFGILLLVICAGLVLLFNWHASGWKALSVPTGSMRPAITPGSLVLMHSVPVAQLRTGDVITYTNPLNQRTTITHRIIKTYKIDGNIPAFVTKGDANPSPDRPVVGGSVQGKIVWHTAYIGHLLNWSKTIWGLLVLIYLPALIIMVGEMRRLAAYFKSQLPYLHPLIMERLAINKPNSIAKGLKLSLMPLGVLTLLLAIAVPVRAALKSNTVALTGNNISVAATQPSRHILIKSVEFECSQDNSPQGNRLAEILFYNPSRTDTPTGNWYVQSSTGRVVTFRPQTVFDAQDTYDIEPDIPLQNLGWQYAGDFLAIFDNNNNLIDGISWGTNTSILNPSLPPTFDGTIFTRNSLTTDTDTAADWTVVNTPCTPH